MNYVKLGCRQVYRGSLIYLQVFIIDLLEFIVRRLIVTLYRQSPSDLLPVCLLTVSSIRAVVLIVALVHAACRHLVRNLHLDILLLVPWH